jgi:hypothetical protein
MIRHLPGLSALKRYPPLNVIGDRWNQRRYRGGIYAIGRLSGDVDDHDL